MARKDWTAMFHRTRISFAEAAGLFWIFRRTFFRRKADAGQKKLLAIRWKPVR